MLKLRSWKKIILSKLVPYSDHDKYQFGFKWQHSTMLCAGIVKQSIEYYISRGSHVFASFVDFSKAFDKVNYWTLFKQLIDDEVNRQLVALLEFWYSHQQATVVWLNTQFSPFCVGNGTKQGGILSPFLFTRYIRPLLAVISSSNVGCNIGGTAVNIFAYADDIVLLAPSWHALQDLLLLLDKCCKELGKLCNTNKTKCMILNPTGKTKIVSQTFPLFTIDGHCLQFVNEFRYLGYIISNN